MSGLEQAREPGSARLVGTMALAGLLSGLLLAGAYEITLPTIEANAKEALRRAVFDVVPGSSRLLKLALSGETFRPADGTEAKNDMAVYAAFAEDGTFRGYAIPAEGPGFQDTIRLIYGYDPRGRRIVGMRVLESRETPGLGDKIFKDESFFVGEFSNLAVETPAPGKDTIVFKKHGTAKNPDEAKGVRSNEIDGITGATISSKSVIRIVDLANKRWIAMLPGHPPALPREELK